MAEILHRLSIHAGVDDVRRAFTHDRVLSWVSVGDVRVCPREENVLEGVHIAWRCVDGPAEWVGTDITIALVPEGRETVVALTHARWASPSAVMASCTTSWARALLHLKRFIETPEPEDLV